ncbi:hypothetical protein SIN8267_02806 [Sinobacterium norvegicum]|uniref:VanZ-like domain-containing protein n=1 Tax=Sinobacterium norvegicum TaxID=1641715 RepID=A0ABM9AIS9_9GAMM|nr:VanZ family protein [Sinobacterium norvegicum]CAH0992673.1 hypothetical protein SIN8267_02806 [Sinobacterium norvegicum]
MQRHILLLYRLLFIAVIVLVIQQSLTPLPAKVFIDSWDKALHIAAWFVVSLTGYLAYGYLSRRRLLLLWVFVFSVVVELGQLCVAGRFFSLFDLVANAIGCLSAWAVISMLERFVPLLWQYRLTGLRQEKT